MQVDRLSERRWECQMTFGKLDKLTSCPRNVWRGRPELREWIEPFEKGFGFLAVPKTAIELFTNFVWERLSTGQPSRQELSTKQVGARNIKSLPNLAVEQG